MSERITATPPGTQRPQGQYWQGHADGADDMLSKCNELRKNDRDIIARQRRELANLRVIEKASKRMVRYLTLVIGDIEE